MNNQTSPLKQIQITPLASESFGVRSMCTLAQTPDGSILLDAGISLCPWRFNLPPHPLEFQTIQTLRKKIAIAADKAHIVTLSHYHYDHYTPSFDDWIVACTTQTETAQQIYQNKTLLIKHPKQNINLSQQQRATVFLKTGAKQAKTVHEADDKTFMFGNTKLHVSKAVPHGEDQTAMGYVTMVTLEYADETFMFAPDIQGPMSNKTQQLILETHPSMLILGGPPFYLTGFRINEASIQDAINNLKDIVKMVPLTILEHHTLRDEFYKQKIKPIQKQAMHAGHRVLTAAEFVGQENQFLEAKRKDLYKTCPITEKFQLWIKNLDRNKISKPPI